MPQRTAVIESLPEAFEMVKAMRAPAGIIRGGLAEDVDRLPGSPDGYGGCDRCNGTHQHRLLCGSGDTGLAVPRVRGYRRVRELRASRTGIDRVILAGLVPGPSTRRTGEILPPCSDDRSRPPPSAASPGPRTPPLPPSMAAASTTATGPSCPTAWCRRPQASRPVCPRPPPRRAQGDYRPPTRPRRKHRRMGAPADLTPPT